MDCTYCAEEIEEDHSPDSFPLPLCFACSQMEDAMMEGEKYVDG